MASLNATLTQKRQRLDTRVRGQGVEGEGEGEGERDGEGEAGRRDGKQRSDVDGGASDEDDASNITATNANTNANATATLTMSNLGEREVLGMVGDLAFLPRPSPSQDTGPGLGACAAAGEAARRIDRGNHALAAALAHQLGGPNIRTIVIRRGTNLTLSMEKLPRDSFLALDELAPAPDYSLDLDLNPDLDVDLNPDLDLDPDDGPAGSPANSSSWDGGDRPLKLPLPFRDCGGSSGSGGGGGGSDSGSSGSGVERGGDGITAEGLYRLYGWSGYAVNRLQMPRWAQGQGLRRQLWWALLGRTHVCDTFERARKFRTAMVRETGACSPIVCLDGSRLDQVRGGGPGVGARVVAWVGG